MASILDRVGLNITIIREQRGLTQEKLAALADLHRVYIGQIERCKKKIPLKNLKIYSFLNYFLGEMSEIDYNL